MSSPDNNGGDKDDSASVGHQAQHDLRIQSQTPPGGVEHSPNQQQQQQQQPAVYSRAMAMATQYSTQPHPAPPSSHSQHSSGQGNDAIVPVSTSAGASREAAVAPTLNLLGEESTTSNINDGEQPPPPRNNVTRMERENFLVFIKILFKLLEDDPATRSRAQRIVLECRRRNQLGDPNFDPLMEGIERHLRVFVGEAKWRRSHLLLHHYIVNKKRPVGGSPATSTTTNSTNRRGRPSAILVGK